MKYFNWNNDKNEQLKKEINLSFEIVIYLIESGRVLDIVENPNQEKYADQLMFIVEFNNYAYLVPFVEKDDEILLKTIIPSRKATKKYLSENYGEIR